MRAASKQIHASSHRHLNWKSVNWKKVEKKVNELQVRIAKAVRERKFRLAKSLQWLLTHSFYSKVLAIRRVVTNKGKATPGVDGVVWNTKKEDAGSKPAEAKRVPCSPASTCLHKKEKRQTPAFKHPCDER